MKKLIIALMLFVVSTSMSAQITIEEKGKEFDFPIKNCYRFVHNTKNGTYHLSINSDNEFENKTVMIQLGNRNESIASLQDILALFEKEGDYKIDKYNCNVTGSYLYFYHIGDLEFTAGSYMTTKTEIKSFLKWLNKH